MLVPSKKPVRRRIALRCIRRSRFRDVLGDGPTTDCPDAYNFASYNRYTHSKEGRSCSSALNTHIYAWHGRMMLMQELPSRRVIHHA